MDNTTTNTFDALSINDLTEAASLPAGRVRRNRAQAAAERALVGRIEDALRRSPVAVVRALELLYARQTSDEQVSHTTRHDNERGFSQSHARTGSWLVTTVIAEGRSKGRAESDLLRGKALEMGLRISLRYARTQLLAVAYEKAAVARNAYTVPTPASMGFAAPANDVTIASLAVELGDAAPTETLTEVAASPSKCSGCQWAGRCESGWVMLRGTEYPCNRD